MRTSLATILDTLAVRDLTRDEAAAIFAALVRGEYAEAEIAALLGALKTRGENVEAITGAAQALRDAARRFPRPEYPFADTCGTGGDALGTQNVSTAVAVVAAELGIPVAKHGNRAVSSRCGSADVLEALGVRIDAPPEQARRCLDAVGLCFLYAPQYHEGVRHAMPVRRMLATRTIFNLLGPLVNPGRPAYQIVGVYDEALCRPMALTLGMLGATAALVVYGDGLDEIALHGKTRGVLWRDGVVTDVEITPEAAGFERRPVEQLRGGEPRDNAAALRRLLAGRGDAAHRDVVALNAGALAWITGKAETIAAGAAAASRILASGRAAERLEHWAEASHGP